MILTIDSIPYELSSANVTEEQLPFKPFQVYYEDINSFKTITDGTQWKCRFSVEWESESTIYQDILSALTHASVITVSGFSKISDGTEVSLIKGNATTITDATLDSESGWFFELEERFPANRFLPNSASSLIQVNLTEQDLTMYIPAIEFTEGLIERRYEYEYTDFTSEEELESVIPFVQIEFKSLLKSEFLKAIIKERLSAGIVKIMVSGSDYFSSLTTVRCKEAVDLKRNVKLTHETWSGVLHFVSVSPLLDIDFDTEFITTI